MILGRLTPTGGSIYRPDGLSIGYLPQQIPVCGRDTVKDYLWQARPGLGEIKKRMDRYLAGLTDDYASVIDYQEAGGYQFDILAERVMTGGQGVIFSGGLSDGVWTLEMTRKLTSDQPGDISLATGEWYNIGFAIHDDYSSARYHHVSLGYKLGFDNTEAEINAIKK